MSKSQSGFSLVELMIAAVILATAVTITINVFGINMNGSSRSRNQLKAQTLAQAKIDEFKDFARRYSLVGNQTFQSLTLSAYAESCRSVSNVVRINDLNFNWRVEATFAYQNGTILADVSSNTVTSKLLLLRAYVTYLEGNSPSSVTLTGYVADISRGTSTAAP